ncbi:1,4-alpha-glucan branching protein GlgB [Pelagovum pacificum]|uniref:1,4-alpha-glucan branching enzyme GlgB n=1 Tax=Pelagovum pacificum TaxID=2588711 RepID=A0A5C5G9M0_9RHOB|nr:1,4-alpha-glucan branching protein GlgB [Pelagovum pacificum]QQA41877.1 1,4-alpha-glucan branching protein GlgB [Pelagovum pacificum]TNY30680.1 1,4-alpha-glucan branching protein GlgB [Pelagovum pacificum]
MGAIRTQPIDAETAEALAEARHPEPCAVLGPHPSGKSFIVTALDPWADELFAVSEGKRHALARIAGPVFSGKVPSDEYRLLGVGEDGATWEYDDAYRYGPVMTEFDEYLLGEGTHQRLWEALGARVIDHEGASGTCFAVWAPNAARVSVIGDFNAWDGRRHVMRRRGGTGAWELFIPDVGDGAAYKYEIITRHGERLMKADPVGFGAQHPPETASVVRDISGYGWKDDDWMGRRDVAHKRDAPISIYEVHLPSWRRMWNENGRPFSYKELAEELISYASWMGFTHLEFMPVSEYPFEGSWGYQPIGLYAPTIRMGPPHEFRDLIDAAHEAGIGVLLDWVPGHFPTDAHGLGRFDGTALYEHSDPREGFHQDWNTLIFNYGRREVANYLVANALYWLEEYHVDGLRVDAVASMLYRDYSRKADEWVPNKDGGRENYEAIALLQRMNTLAYGENPGVMTVAEESTSFPGVSRPVDHGGLGFGYKWNMGWMNDTLDYISRDPAYRKYHHHQMTNTINWAFSENFILPISHDEIVHGKGSMLEKMPGDEWQKFANLRAYYGYMWGHPGKKLLFMGTEFGQDHEWNHDSQIDWEAAQRPMHKGVQSLVRDLNRVYRETPALHVKDCEPDGFQWVDYTDADQSVLSWLRFGGPDDAPVLVVSNFTPVERSSFRLGVPEAGFWAEILNTDAAEYGGTNAGSMGGVTADAEPAHGQAHSISITLPPLATVMFRLERGAS